MVLILSLTNFRFRSAMLLTIAALSSVVATAQTRTLTQADIQSMLPGLQVRQSENNPGMLTLDEWRESELALSSFGFQLTLYWNGLDDENWPFERIVATVASRFCGPVTAGGVKNQVARLYRTRSLIRKKNLGGNAGTSFKKRLSSELGSCKAEFAAEGARWHALVATVVRVEGASPG
jgi:hypothetical protein